MLDLSEFDKPYVTYCAFRHNVGHLCIYQMSMKVAIPLDCLFRLTAKLMFDLNFYHIICNAVKSNVFWFQSVSIPW